MLRLPLPVAALRLGGALLVALTAGGCAPPADFRPPSALAFGDRSFEAGAGLVRVSKRPYVDEPSHDIGQAWLTARAASWVSFSAVSAFDKVGALGGVSALFRVVRTERVVLGTSVEAGYAWGGASVSGAARLFEDSWLYAAPRIANWGDVPSFGIPVGVSLHVYDGFHVRAEWQTSWADFKYYNRRTHLGIAAAYDF